MALHKANKKTITQTKLEQKSKGIGYMFSIFKLLKLYKRRHIIKKSGLFDEIYYLKLYPDVRAADIDPIEHYYYLVQRKEEILIYIFRLVFI